MKIRFFVVLVFSVLFTVFPTQAFAAEWYVSPTGTAGGNGSMSSPWDLQTALSHPASVQPGDTIWLRGGTYSGTFVSTLTGTSGNPIIVRQYSGERAILDGGTSSNATLSTHNSIYSSFSTYTHYWGFVIKHTSTDRISSQTGSAPSDICIGDGIDHNEGKAGNKFINLVIHDNCGNGVVTNDGGEDTEFYGNIVYYNGWDASDRGHGHGFYFQSLTATKTLKDNILFDGHSMGIKLYGVNGHINNFVVDGNISFNNGILSTTTGYAWNLQLGGENQVALNSTVTSNYTYFDPANSGGNNEVGYVAGCDDATITNNYFSKSNAVTGGNIFAFRLNCTNVSMTGNTFIGPTSGFSQVNYPDNAYYNTPPPVTKVFVRPNTYESERANIVIYNWKNSENVAVDVSSVLSNNQTYNLYDVQNYFGSPVLSGTYSGGNILVPMTSTTMSTPVGISAPAHTPQEFGAFVLIGGAQTSATPTPTSTQTPATAANIDTSSIHTTTSNPDSAVSTYTGSLVAASFPTVKLTQTSTGTAFISGDKTFIEKNISFSGKAPANALVEITLISDSNKTISGVSSAKENGNWSWSPPPNLKAGNYSASFFVQDKQGNTGMTTLKFTIDEDGKAAVEESIQEISGEFVENKRDESQNILDDFIKFLKETFLMPLQNAFH